MYISETQKIRPLMLKYCSGSVIDIGCGSDLICKDAVGVDVRKLPTVKVITNDLSNLSKILTDRYDFVFSSHCLEHFKDDRSALCDWFSLVKKDGHMGLYLPDDRKYDNDKNPEHLHRYTYKQFISFLGEVLPEAKIVDSGEHFGEDLYSFYVILRRA